jgi:hypothetical protein
MWGWGAMNPTAIKEATKIRYPMDKFIGVWWSGGNDDAAAGGEGCQGLQGPELPRRWPTSRRGSRTSRSTSSTPACRDRPAKHFGQTTSTTAVSTTPMLVAEGIRTAQELTGKKVIDRRRHADGSGSLNMDRSSSQGNGHGRLCAPDEADLRRSLRQPRSYVHSRMGRHRSGSRHRLVRADDVDVVKSAARSCGQGICREKRSVAGADRTLPELIGSPPPRARLRRQASRRGFPDRNGSIGCPETPITEAAAEPAKRSCRSTISK